jgi:hypothetical protein
MPDPKTGKPKAQMLTELRCLNKQGQVGLQTMVPNSIHPNGERVRFEPGLDDEPSPVDADALGLAVAKTAATVLLSWFFPAPGGGRHAAFLALAGLLLRNSGWPYNDVVTFHCALYRLLWPADADFVAARTEVESTRDSIDQGLPVTPFIVGPAGTGFGASANTGQSGDTGGSTTGGAAGGTSVPGSTYGHSQPPGIAYGYAIQYSSSQPGVYFFPQDPNEPPVFVSSPIEVIGIAADDDFSTY